MSTSRRLDLRIRIHAAGTLTPSDGTVAYTLDGLTEVPAARGQMVRPTEGKTALGNWTFKVPDTDGQVTSVLATAGGRMQLLGRVTEYQERVDGGSWATQFIGRLAAVSKPAEGTAYTLSIEDERWVERNFQPFTAADTAYLWPAGLVYPWRRFKASDRVLTGTVLSTSGSMARIELAAPWPFGGLSTKVLEWIRDDLVELPRTGVGGTENFRHLRALVDGDEERVLTFGSLAGTDFLRGLEQFEATSRERPGVFDSRVAVWVTTDGTWTTTPGTTVEVRFWAPTAPPSETLPLHIGTGDMAAGSDSAHTYGQIHPFELLEALYTEAGVRFDSAAVAALQALPFPYQAWDVTDPEVNLAEWADANLYAPNGVVPFRNDDGELSPRSVLLPNASTFDVDTAFVLNADNCVSPPTFDHQAAELVNRLTIEGKRYRSGAPDDTAFAGTLVGYRTAEGDERDFRADYLEVFDVPGGPFVYDSTADTTGEQVIRAHGHPSRPPLISLLAQTGLLRQEVFERYGDGPQWGSVVALRSEPDANGDAPGDLLPGDIVVLDIDSWPNAATQSLGGQRVVQIMGKAPTLTGVRLEFLDAGPALQPLAAPSVSVALNGTAPRHAVDITVSSVPAGATATVEVDDGDGTWSRVVTGVGNETVTVAGLPSGTLITVRARSVAPNRTRSSLSSTDDVTTTALTAPTLGSPSVTSLRVTLPWSGGTADYDLVPVYRVNGSGTWLEAPLLPAGSTRYIFTLSQASTLYDIGVKLVDRFGGESSVASTTATTGSLGAAINPPSLLYVIQGDTGVTLPPRSEVQQFGHGIQVGLVPSSLEAQTRIRVDTSASFTSPKYVVLPPGTRDALILLPLDDTTRYIGAQHEVEGASPSAWTDSVSAKPAVLYASMQGREIDGRVVLALNASGALVSVIGEGVGSDNGSEVLPLARGYESGSHADGATVLFNRTFDGPPMVVLTGGKTVDGTYPDREAEDLSAAGFTMRAKNRTVSSLTPQTDTFAAGTATDVGETVECNLDPGGAVGGSYTVQYDLSIDYSLGGGAESLNVSVAIDTNDGGGWTERATRGYFMPGGNSGSWNNETVGITVSGLGLNDDVRVRIKNIIQTGGSSIYSVTLDPDQVDYQTDAGGSEVSATPDSGEKVRWQALEVG